MNIIYFYVSGGFLLLALLIYLFPTKIISGLNTMSKEERKTVNIPKLKMFVAWATVVVAILFFGMVFVPRSWIGWLNPIVAVGYCLVVCIIGNRPSYKNKKNNNDENSSGI